MSETWNTGVNGDGEWSASAPISSLPSDRRIWKYTQTYKGTTPSLYVLSSVRLTEAEAQAKINDFVRSYGGSGYTFALVGATSTAAQPANGQKAPAPMKLTFARVPLIASLQSVIDAATAKFDEAQTMFDAAKVTATAVVDANLESIAVANGFKADDAGLAAFKGSPSYGYAVTNMQATLGLVSIVPSKPNNKSVEASIATLALATDTNLEIEEGHAFLQHLRQ